jgi:hypothetical protein
MLGWAGYVAQMDIVLHKMWGTSWPAERVLAFKEVSYIGVMYEN